MPDPSVTVVTPAASNALITLADLKTMLLMSPTDTTRDGQLQMLIDQNSAVIATMCNRDYGFGYATFAETWRCVDPVVCPDGTHRVFLTHPPVLSADLTDVESPVGTVIDPSLYELEEKDARLTLFAGAGGAGEILVKYSGGYVLPNGAPLDLQQCVGLMVRQVQAELTMAAGTGAGVRMVAHKESRVTYFSPRDMMAFFAGGAGKMGPMAQTIQNIIDKYTRFWI